MNSCSEVNNTSTIMPATSIYGRLGALFHEIHAILAIRSGRICRVGNSEDRASPPLVSWVRRSFFFCKGGGGAVSYLRTLEDCLFYPSSELLDFSS